MSPPRTVDWASSQARRADNLLGDISDDGLADRLDEAIRLYGEALAVFRQHGANPDAAGVNVNLGDAYRRRIHGVAAENLDHAIDCFTAAIEQFELDHQVVFCGGAQMLLGLALSNRINGARADNVRRAVVALQAAREAILPQWAPQMHATILYNLGYLYLELLEGDHAQNVELAIDALQAALGIFVRDGQRAESAATSLVLGQAHTMRLKGDRAQNIEAAIDALQAASEQYADEGLPVEWAAAQVALAQIYMDRLLGEPAANIEFAIGALRAALEVHTKTEYPYEWAWTKNKLGLAYRRRVRGAAGDNLERAVAEHRAALEVLVPGRDANEWAVVQNDLASSLSSRVYGQRIANLRDSAKAYETALSALEQSSSGRVSGTKELADDTPPAGLAPQQQRWSFPLEPIGRAGIQHNLALTYMLCWEEGGAAADLERAVIEGAEAFAFFQDAGLLKEAVQVGCTLAVACRRDGQWGRSADTYVAVCDAIDMLYSTSLLLSSKAAELADIAGVYRQAAYVLAKAGRLDQAVATVERGRARLLGDALDLEALMKVAREQPDTHGEFLGAAERLQRLEIEERSLPTRGGRQLWDRDLRSMEMRMVDEARAARQAFDEAMLHLEGSDAHDSVAQPSDGDVASAIARGVPLAYIITAEAGTLTLLVEQNESGASRPVVTPIWDDSFTSDRLSDLLIRAEGRTITGGFLPAQEHPQWLSESLAAALPILGTHIAGPLAEALAARQASGVVLIPCGDLGLLPIHSALYSRDGTERCLLDEFDVGFAPSGRVLSAQREVRRAQGSPAKTMSSPVLAGVGDPLLDPPHSLEWAAAELTSIASLFDEAHTLYDELATTSALFGAIDGASYVHLACHGRFRPEAPMESFVALAGHDRLTLRTIIDKGLFQDVYLVVGSACQTAVVDYLRLPDEMINLISGFLYAGARFAIGSLWPVADLSTALMMERFYRYHLHGDLVRGEDPMSPALALRRAQRWLASVQSSEVRSVLETPHFEPTLTALSRDPAKKRRLDRILRNSNTPFAEPFHWAPWLLVGAPSSI